MQTICHDLLAEYRGLADLCETLTPAQWQQPSAFYGWAPWDEIAHLCYFDETGLQSATDPEAFTRDAALLNKRMERGEEISAVARERYGSLTGPALLTRWRELHEGLVGALAKLDPKSRLAWYGPPMSARSFATARLMETWAHGQDVWDVVRRRRPSTARLKHIAHLGVTTFRWTFVNRKLEPPPELPYVELSAADGSLWTWNQASPDAFARGSAEDFCLLVTQRRHLDDTGLQHSGDGVKQWLLMAQCFAGPPAEGPAPGVRQVVY
jgi:uncharacterized protein (TIGR03084 family)